MCKHAVRNQIRSNNRELRSMERVKFLLRYGIPPVLVIKMWLYTTRTILATLAALYLRHSSKWVDWSTHCTIIIFPSSRALNNFAGSVVAWNCMSTAVA